MVVSAAFIPIRVSNQHSPPLDPYVMPQSTSGVSVHERKVCTAMIACIYNREIRACHGDAEENEGGGEK